MGSDRMRVLTTEGLHLLIVEDDDARRIIGEHHHAIRRAMEGDVSALTPFRRRTISARTPGAAKWQPFELEASLPQLKRWYAQGELDYEDIYEQ